MKLDIRAGKRVLYKHNGKWEVGVLEDSKCVVINDKGLFLFIIPKEFIGMNKDEIPFVHDAEFNDIFFDVVKLNDCLKDYSDCFMTKEQYEKFIESEDFDKHYENAYVSDGEYIYYPVSKYNKSWIEKQPFDYIVRGE